MAEHGGVYSNAFYERQSGGSLRSAGIVLAEVFRLYRPNSIVDIGAGLGTWLKAAMDLGVEDVLGVDGHQVAADKLLIDPAKFARIDFATDMPCLDRRFDLAISVEVAEHLPHLRADAFVQTLADAADTVLFSAAIPGQGGRQHVNEQFPSYWIPRFAEHGFRCFDALRPALWDRQDVRVWYRQNLLMFSRDREFPGELPSAGAYDRVHPGLWMDPKIMRKRFRRLIWQRLTSRW